MEKNFLKANSILVNITKGKRYTIHCKQQFQYRTHISCIQRKLNENRLIGKEKHIIDNNNYYYYY